jgi:hypothetical protein
MSYNYKLTFWDIQAGTGDVGAAVRAQIAKAALTLQEHPAVTFASSAGGYDDKETPEIALLVPVDHDTIELQRFVLKAVLAEGLAANLKVSLKSNIAYYDLEDRHLAAIERATYIADLNAARAEIDTLVDLPRSQPTSVYDPKAFLQPLIDKLTNMLQASSVDNASFYEAEATTLVTKFPAEEIIEEISVSADMYAKMKKAQGDDIKNLVEDINKTLKEIKADGENNNTNQAVFDMIQGEVVTIGKEMWEKYAGLKSAGSLGAMISGLIASVGGVQVVAAIAAAITLVFFLFWITVWPKP